MTEFMALWYNKPRFRKGRYSMKLMIASDIHGSFTYCKQLMDAFDKEQPQKLILLGDILYHGPRNALPDGYSPQDVAKLLNERKKSLLCIRGNCEAEVDQMMLEFPVLADYAVMFWQGKTIYMAHGHHPVPPMQEGDILLSGHTHIPLYAKIDGTLRLNPGSVSIPKENSHHGYMILEDSTAYWKELDGTIVRTEAID